MDQTEHLQGLLLRLYYTRVSGEPSFQDADIEETCVNIHYNSEENRWVWNDVPEDILSEVPYYSGRIGYIVEYERNPQ